MSLRACLPAEWMAHVAFFVFFFNSSQACWQMVTCRRWPSSKSTETGTKALNMFTWFHYEQHSPNIDHIQTLLRQRSDAGERGVTYLEGWRPIKVVKWRRHWQIQEGVYYGALHWQQMETFARCSSSNKGKYHRSTLCFVPGPVVCSCVLRERAHTCLMLLIYALLISINESHANYMPLIISFSFSSAQFKETFIHQWAWNEVRHKTGDDERMNSCWMTAGRRNNIAEVWPNM